MLKKCLKNWNLQKTGGFTDFLIDVREKKEEQQRVESIQKYINDIDSENYQSSQNSIEISKGHLQETIKKIIDHKNSKTHINVYEFDKSRPNGIQDTIMESLKGE